MLLKSSLLAAVLGLTLAQPVLGGLPKGASVELSEKHGKCIFHINHYPREGCSGTQTKAEGKKEIGKVKDGKCTFDSKRTTMSVKHCKHMQGGKPPFEWFNDGGSKGKLGTDPDVVEDIDFGFDIGTKAVWNGEKWDVSKK